MQAIASAGNRVSVKIYVRTRQRLKRHKLAIGLVKELLKKLGDAKDITPAQLSAAVIASARPARLPLPAATLTDAGQQLIKAPIRNPETWAAFSEVVNFRTEILSGKTEVNLSKLPDCANLTPTIEVDDPEAAKEKKKAVNYRPVGPYKYKGCRLQLDRLPVPSQNYMIVIPKTSNAGAATIERDEFPERALRTHGIECTMCVVSYHGGPIVTKVRMIDCQYFFDVKLEPPAQGLRFALDVLKSPAGLVAVG